MNLEGLEMIAVLVVVVLFVKVLEQFGLLADSYDGKETANSFHVWKGWGFFLFFFVAINHLLLPKFKTSVVCWDCILTVSLSEASAVTVIICRFLS